MKTAVVIGATGLVGTQLVQLLLADDRFGKVYVFGRHTLGISSPKLEEHLINFDTPEAWQHLVKGDVFFSTLGTTLKQAGGQNQQYKVDYLYQYQFGQAAARNGMPVYVLVSSPGASPDSVIFYTRMKGTLERDVKKLEFQSMNFVQPGLLYGDREEERTGEKIGFKVLNLLNQVGVLHKYRPIHGKVVAQAIIKAGVAAKPGVHTYTLMGVFDLAGVENG